MTFIIFTSESVYQIYQNRDVLLDCETYINEEAFANRIENGEKLVLVEDYIVNIEPFMSKHPGGEFALRHNVGKDVTKFFFGGQALAVSSKVAPHQHSNAAKRILKSLIIGKLSPVAP